MQFAWERLRSDLGGILLPLGVALAIEAIPGLIGTRLGPHSDDPMRMLEPDALRVSFFTNFLAIVVRSFLDGGVNQFCLDVVRGKPYSMGTVFGSVRLFPAYFAMNFVQSFAIGLGLILFVVPGVVLAVAFSLADPALVDRGLGGIGALSWSWEATKGQRGKLFVYFLLVIALVMLGACACGVGIFVAMPIVWLARAHIYASINGG
jgi:uncharacterized membrane protein